MEAQGLETNAPSTSTVASACLCQERLTATRCSLESRRASSRLGEHSSLAVPDSSEHHFEEVTKIDSFPSTPRTICLSLLSLAAEPDL